MYAIFWVWYGLVDESEKCFFHGIAYLFAEFLILTQWKSKENLALSEEQHQPKIAEQLCHIGGVGLTSVPLNFIMGCRIM